MTTQPTARTPRRLAALLVGAGLVASAVFAGTPAQAADVDIPSAYGTYVGELHVEPSSGTWDEKLTRVWTDTAFDPAVTTATHPFVWLTLQKGNFSGGLGTLNSNALYTGPLHGPYNFGSSADATGGDMIARAFSGRLSSVTTIDTTAVGSTFSALVHAKATTSNPSPGNPYFRADFEVTATGWKVAGAAPVVKTDTVTTLAASALNTGAVTLAATVAPATATGTVSFRDGAGAEVANVEPVNGVAAWTSGVLTEGTTYSYTAAYSGDALHNTSTSNVVTVTTVAEPAPPQDTNITVTIPASATGLQFTITPGDVALGQPTLDGTNYVATGALGTVTVSDSRAARTAWTLNGKAGDFVGLSDATKTIAASNLGWVPAAVGATNAGIAGAAVVAGIDGGLSNDKPLAQAPAGVTSAQTTVNAAFTLKAPVDSAAGNYAAKLTLTLI